MTHVLAVAVKNIKNVVVHNKGALAYVEAFYVQKGTP